MQSGRHKKQKRRATLLSCQVPPVVGSNYWYKSFTFLHRSLALTLFILINIYYQTKHQRILWCPIKLRAFHQNESCLCNPIQTFLQASVLLQEILFIMKCIHKQKLTPASHVSKAKDGLKKVKDNRIISFACSQFKASRALKPSVMRKCRVGFFIVSIHKMHHVGRTLFLSPNSNVTVNNSLQVFEMHFLCRLL